MTGIAKTPCLRKFQKSVVLRVGAVKVVKSSRKGAASLETEMEGMEKRSPEFFMEPTGKVVHGY